MQRLSKKIKTDISTIGKRNATKFVNRISLHLYRKGTKNEEESDVSKKLRGNTVAPLH